MFLQIALGSCSAEGSGLSDVAEASSRSVFGLVGLEHADCWPFVSGILLKGSH